MYFSMKNGHDCASFYAKILITFEWLSVFISRSPPPVISRYCKLWPFKKFLPPPLNLSSSSIPPLRALGRSPHVHTLTYTLTCLLKTDPFCSAPLLLHLATVLTPGTYSFAFRHVQTPSSNKHTLPELFEPLDHH